MAQKITFVLLIVAFLSSCATSQKPVRAEETLVEQAKLWDQFRIDGIIEYNYKQLSFRKNIVIRKSDERFRIDIFDTGLFGARPTPFLTIYREDDILIRDENGTREADPVSDSLYVAWTGQISSLSQVIRQHYNEILTTWQFEDFGLKYQFSWNYLLESISSAEGNHKLEIAYTTNDRPAEIRYLENGSTVIDIIIDKITYEPIQVKVLTHENQGNP